MANFEISVAHLYGNLMNTYGDYGNIIALTYYAKQIGVAVNYHLVSLGDNFDADNFDFALFGGGQDYEETIVAKDLKNKADQVRHYIENDGPLLAVCGGFQLLGHYMVMADGTKVDGIGVMDHYTTNMHDPKLTTLNNKRLTGNIVIKNNDTAETYHGFENHQGRTFLGENERALGTVISGNGNNGMDKTEGVIYRNVYGSYFHGPIFTRNGNLAKRVLATTLSRKYPEVDWADKLDQIETETF
ncbi:glutamine amidotransferase [Leuconostoc gelidum subsp. gelidum]|uniref:Lipid II isoglutaminyl synthase (glutamine-hydrolyzing) subunit GatD n=1 Tax=Leuconostoc gelidum subsp. gelidum TaxID=1607839 RepID=A0AB35G1G4_LEUGE|nr:glutamine amidotransferase [Leuconostoc gelidum]MBZ5964656.1 glutamine amidotransferase [Leuconostoc gelidum subsp. gelidum]MBZ5974739.1 glutamine amidotransferase [Leuconostoc gelidum subsp. gelidum]MBZ5977579.1 glutamine amidotransferase [Leuconostoc gelidum subsp. gelidum]MBZ5986483.1 glutamine amidotransferase [Leuconostoc gelidum subsp. gelidum]MBZ5999290.1 glutamine amidotransferase [Leuconostoc gelidum subsp. gelidum]